MSISTQAKTEMADQFQNFLDQYYRDAIGELARRYPSEQKSLTVKFSDIERFDHGLADDYVANPGDVQDAFDTALQEYDLPLPESLTQAHVRVVMDTERYTVDVGEYSPSEDRGSLVPIRGLVDSVTKERSKITEAAFECQRCGEVTWISQSGSGGDFQEPHECDGCERQGPFVVDFDQSEFVDHQAIRLALPPERATGSSGEKIRVDLEDDLTGQVYPGDRVHTSSILRLEPESETSNLFDPYGEGLSVSVQETDFDNVPIEEHEEQFKMLADSQNPYERLVQSILPTHEGDEMIKQALGLQLFGAPTVEQPDGSKIRGQSHVLLIGDPGVGKSSLLQYVKKLAPRSVYTSGKGSSAAGLTAAAVRDEFGEGQWSIEGGAMVKADKGVACVDELDKADENDRSAMHEALEEGTVSVSKAGMTPTLNARTTLLAAANPKYGRFDKYESIADQIDLDPPLVSRFDLIFTMFDDPEEEKDSVIADHKTETWDAGLKLERGEDIDEHQRQCVEPEVEPDVLRAWIAYARKNIVPTPTEEAKQKIRDEFVNLRLANDDDVDEEEQPVPVTFRKQEAIQRLAAASARIRLSETITTDDVDRAFQIIMSCLADVGIDTETGQFDADIIATGSSMSQDKRKKTILRIIRKNESETEFGTKKATLKQLASNQGISMSKLKHELSEFKKDGEVYEPKPDHYRVS